MKRVVALFLFLLLCMLSLTCYSEAQDDNASDVSWQSFVNTYNILKAYAPNPLDENYYDLMVGALELPIYSISVVQLREYSDANQTPVGAETNETLKRLNRIMFEEAASCYESGIYDPGVIDKVIGFNFDPNVDYVSDMTWLSTLLDEYEQEKNARLSSESNYESEQLEDIIPTNGVDVVKFSNADDGKILFRDIPWGSSMQTALKMLEKDGMADGYSNLTENTSVIAWDDASLTYFPNYVSNAGDSLYVIPKAKVAGYELNSLNLYSMYKIEDGVILRDEPSELQLAIMSFDVIDTLSAYQDLKQKLTSLYGEPEEDSYEGGGYSPDTGSLTSYQRVSTWNGANNTGIKLYVMYSIDDDDPTVDLSTAFFSDLSIMYGKTDSADRLAKLEEAVHEEELSTEQNNQAQNASNVEGL